ncbi:hypothetical protein CS369_15210 [Candidatus Symbiopectobacterium sp. 'North America']|nr:hypothetical protein [Candidatus Symbiopectobacterium sp. 'North America']
MAPVSLFGNQTYKNQYNSLIINELAPIIVIYLSVTRHDRLPASVFTSTIFIIQFGRLSPAEPLFSNDDKCMP